MLCIHFLFVSVGAGVLLSPSGSATVEQREDQSNNIVAQQDELTYLRSSPIVQQLLSDEDMRTKLSALSFVMKGSRVSHPEEQNKGHLSLLQVNPVDNKNKKAADAVQDAMKELEPVEVEMRKLDPNSAKMLQSVIQMVGALTHPVQRVKNTNKSDASTISSKKVLKHDTSSETRPLAASTTKASASKKTKTTGNQKKAFMQTDKENIKTGKDDEHDSLRTLSFSDGQNNINKGSTSADPAVMEERLMRIQPILLRLKQMNSKLFGGLANVASVAERHAEDEVVYGK